MAIVVYPLNDIDFTAEDVSIYNSTRTSGIYAGDDFAISLTGSDNTIGIDVGLAWMHLSRFHGVAVALKAKTFVDMGLPNATYPRIDALVLQFNANKNGAELVSKQGTASSNPQPPAVSRTASLYELHLLHVRRNPGAASISAADVTDLRLNDRYCGLMADAVTRVDTAAIDAQVTALIQKLRDSLQNVEDQTYYASKDFVEERFSSAQNYADIVSSPFNYADNSDFEHWVAQAGIGGQHGTQAYAGDRWILDSGTVTGESNENGDGYRNITLTGTIRQIVANPPDVGTVAINMISGTAQISYANGEITITSNGGRIKNVRLFDGEYTSDTIPRYMPPKHIEELMECMRYYRRMDADAVLSYHGQITGTTRVVVNMGTWPFRVVPTVVMSDDFKICIRLGTGGYSTVTGNEGKKPNSIHGVYAINSMIAVYFEMGKSPGANNMAVVSTITDGYLELIADL